MRPNILKTLRMKMMLCAAISGTCTAIIDGILVLLIYFLKSSEFMKKIFHITQSPVIKDAANVADNVADKTFDAVGMFRDGLIMIRPQPFLTKYVALDVIVFIVFTLVIYMTFYMVFSHNIIEYFKDINRGVERIREGDLDTNIPVKGYDEISDLAYSINNMRVELKQSIAKERELEKTKNELITNVAHDLRTPLTSMTGYLELIKGNRDIDDETREKYINIAYDKSKRLERLVTDLFDYTRFEKNKLQLSLVKLNITKFVEQLAEEFYPSIEEKRLELITSFPKTNLYRRGDGELLARALGNLLSNAIKYGAYGKQIRMELLEDREHNHVIFRVTNYGRLIPQKDIGKIFEQFYRVDASRTSTGTGLGLAIAKNIIEMHKGRIEAKSDEEGTVFEVFFNMNDNYELGVQLK